VCQLTKAAKLLIGIFVHFCALVAKAIELLSCIEFATTAVAINAILT